MVLREWEEKINKSKQSDAIIPNIIHSLDASHLMNVVISAVERNITPVISVHDCFGTHPNKLESLAHLVKIEFIKLYTQEIFLKKFHDRNLQSISDNNIKIHKDELTDVHYVLLKRTRLNLPEIPKLGNLDLNKIIHSKYMIT